MIFECLFRKMDEDAVCVGELADTVKESVELLQTTTDVGEKTDVSLSISTISCDNESAAVPWDNSISETTTENKEIVSQTITFALGLGSSSTREECAIPESEKEFIPPPISIATIREGSEDAVDAPVFSHRSEHQSDKTDVSMSVVEDDSTSSLIRTDLSKFLAPEEDSQSRSSFKVPLVPELPATDVVIPPEEDSQSSVGSQRSGSKRRHEDVGITNFVAENLFEYQWPPDQSGEYYILQEQISEFLAVKSFKRKYPDLFRRQVETEEKEFLKERGVVSETQCDLGLTALRADEVIDLMARDCPDKYQDYERVLHEKEKQSINDKHKGYCTPRIDKAKLGEFVRKAIRSASEWNHQFNRERAEERRASYDLQTNTVHYPVGGLMPIDKEATKVYAYPVALVPGQFQNHCRVYTSTELKYLPLNTVLYGPNKYLDSLTLQRLNAEINRTDSDDSSSSDGSTSDSSQGTGEGSAENSSSEQLLKKQHVVKPPPGPPPPKRKGRPPKNKPPLTSATCRVCRQTKQCNKNSKPEEFVLCSECHTGGHPSCLKLPPELVEVIRTYRWQCMDCKRCVMCSDPHDEEKMMFCDRCDRGFHTFCVGIKNLPSGRWVCEAQACRSSVEEEQSGTGKWSRTPSRRVNGSKPLPILKATTSKNVSDAVPRDEAKVRPLRLRVKQKNPAFDFT